MSLYDGRVALRPLEVTGVDAGSAPDATADWLRARVLEHKLVVLRDQHLTPPKLSAALARRLGSARALRVSPGLRHARGPAGHESQGGSRPSLLAQRRDDAARAAVAEHSLRGARPSGRRRHAFLDSQAAYEDLPDQDKRRLDGLRAVQPNGVEQPIVRSTPRPAGRRCTSTSAARWGSPAWERRRRRSRSSAACGTTTTSRRGSTATGLAPVTCWSGTMPPGVARPPRHPPTRTRPG